MNPAKVYVTDDESAACPAAADPTGPGCQAWERGVTLDDWYCDAEHCPYRADHEVGPGRAVPDWPCPCHPKRVVHRGGPWPTVDGAA